jgi:hypothetical protein
VILYFGRDYVYLRSHRLSAQSFTRGMSVAFYSKNGKIKRRLLKNWKSNKKNKKKAASEKFARK